MASQKLKIVAEATMVTIPPALLSQLGWKAEAAVDVTIEDGRIVITKAGRPCYTLDELVAKCDASKDFSDDEQTWMNEKPVGGEIL